LLFKQINVGREERAPKEVPLGGVYPAFGDHLKQRDTPALQELNAKTALTQRRKGRREAQRKANPDFELLCVL
jgi:hypothetical protein